MKDLEEMVLRLNKHIESLDEQLKTVSLSNKKALKTHEPS
jgi:hypothetical protein